MTLLCVLANPNERLTTHSSLFSSAFVQFTRCRKSLCNTPNGHLSSLRLEQIESEMRARGAAKKVAVRRDDENAAPTIEGDDDDDRDDTSHVMSAS